MFCHSHWTYFNLTIHCAAGLGNFQLMPIIYFGFLLANTSRQGAGGLSPSQGHIFILTFFVARSASGYLTIMQLAYMISTLANKISITNNSACKFPGRHHPASASATSSEACTDPLSMQSLRWRGTLPLALHCHFKLCRLIVIPKPTLLLGENTSGSAG